MLVTKIKDELGVWTLAGPKAFSILMPLENVLFLVLGFGPENNKSFMLVFLNKDFRCETFTNDPYFILA
jgi:hypothetical protein